jgi:hypothetical protein
VCSKHVYILDKLLAGCWTEDLKEITPGEFRDAVVFSAGWV